VSNRHLNNRLRMLSVNLDSLVTSAGFDFCAHDPGFLAVGDAAGSPAPVLGQGLAMALQSGLLAAQLIDQGLQNGFPGGVDASANAANRTYEIWQKTPTGGGSALSVASPDAGQDGRGGDELRPRTKPLARSPDPRTAASPRQ
jgi:hypothetical protein